MTVTSVVSFALCCASWLSTLILITAHLAVKGQYVIVYIFQDSLLSSRIELYTDTYWCGCMKVKKLQRC